MHPITMTRAGLTTHASKAPIIVGIDGTGADDNNAYASDFTKSFVNRICGKPSLDSLYFRGPITLGGGLLEAVFAGRDFIVQRLKERGDNARVLLTGYSRGGAGVIAIAKLLSLHKIPVEAMLLFDAVNRHLALSTGDVPANVADVLHVRRDPSSASRVSFGNCGLAHFPPVQYRQSFFKCTHGGMGGTPWPVPSGKSPHDFVDESLVPNTFGFRANPTIKLDARTNVTYFMDAKISSEIWSFVQPFIRKHNFI